MKKTIQIPLGSQHISLLEPIRFKFECENEKIIGVDADVGFVHRGVELACTRSFEFKQVGMSSPVFADCVLSPTPSPILLPSRNCWDTLLMIGSNICGC
jgi:Ni,Fe-hydrogenase III large subunit